MGLVLILAAAVAIWAWKERRVQTLRYGDVAAGVAALVALNAFRSHQVGLGVVGLGLAGGWLWWRQRMPAFAADALDGDEARALLELPRGASGDEVRAAHRRLIARVHPDAGGSAELARRVNAARDLLLDEVNSRAARAS